MWRGKATQTPQFWDYGNVNMDFTSGDVTSQRIGRLLAFIALVVSSKVVASLVRLIPVANRHQYRLDDDGSTVRNVGHSRYSATEKGKAFC